MFTKDSIDWSGPTTIDDEDFPKDTLGRVQYAQFLTNFLKNEGYTKSRSSEDIKRNYVLNLNSEWGSGKTYFLKRWSEDLKVHFPVVYIDAWKQDYSDDPLMTAISSVINQLRDQAGIDIQKSDFAIPKKVVGLFKAAAPALLKTFSKKYFGDEGFIDLSDVAADAVTHLLDEHEEKSQAIDDLKISVAKWVSFITDNPEDDKTYPAFIFIDELDRCRPSYAVEMLETIKHIFDIKGIVFVVATDTEQLQHAVKAIYGEGFNAQLYLGRFFNSRFSLKAPDLKDFLEVHVDHTKLSGGFLEERGIKILPPNPDGKVTLRNIAVILDAFKMPPRTAIQIADRVIATLSNMPTGSKIDILMLTTLLCFNEEDSEQFQRIISGQLSYQDKSNREKGITGYLKNRFRNDISEITMYFNPTVTHPKLDTNIPSYTRNDYREKLYSLSFIGYLKDIFTIYFSSEHNPIVTYTSLGNGSHKGTQNQYVQAQLYQNEKNSEESSLQGSLWLQALYYRGNFNEVTLEKYKDYVELASALDWIDGDASSDDA